MHDVSQTAGFNGRIQPRRRRAPPVLDTSGMKRVGGIWKRGSLASAIVFTTTTAIAVILLNVYGFHDGWHWGLVLPAGYLVLLGPAIWWRNGRRTQSGKQAPN